MKDYTSKQPFGKDIDPRNTPGNFTNLSNGPQTADKKPANGGAGKFANPSNKPNTDTKRIQSITKSDASGRSSGGSFGSFIGQ